MPTLCNYTVHCGIPLSEPLVWPQLLSLALVLPPVEMLYPPVVCVTIATPQTRTRSLCVFFFPAFPGVAEAGCRLGRHNASIFESRVPRQHRRRQRVAKNASHHTPPGPRWCTASGGRRRRRQTGGAVAVGVWHVWLASEIVRERREAGAVILFIYILLNAQRSI